MSFTDEVQEEFIYNRGLELAEFISWLIKEKQIPTIQKDNDGTVVGGLKLVGWSLGSEVVLALCAHLGEYPRDITSTIRPFLRPIVLYGEGHSLGI